MLTVIDNYFRKVWVYILKHKNGVFEKFKQWKTMIDKQTRNHIKFLRIDNGVEFYGTPSS